MLQKEISQTVHTIAELVVHTSQQSSTKEAQIHPKRKFMEWREVDRPTKSVILE